MKKILKNFMLNVSIADPVGRNLDFFTQINERLERECLRFLWDSPDSCKTITQLVLNNLLHLNIAKAIKKEAVLKPDILKSEQDFFSFCEKFIVEHDQFQDFQSSGSTPPSPNRNEKHPREPVNPQQMNPQSQPTSSGHQQKSRGLALSKVILSPRKRKRLVDAYFISLLIT